MTKTQLRTINEGNIDIIIRKIHTWVIYGHNYLFYERKDLILCLKLTEYLVEERYECWFIIGYSSLELSKNDNNVVIDIIMIIILKEYVR